METQKCKKCQVDKSLNLFYRHSTYINGRLSKCKECVSNYTKELGTKTRYVPESGVKKCCRCHLQRPITDFHARLRNSDGLRSECKECTRSQEHAYRSRHPEAEYFRRTKQRYGLSEDDWLALFAKQNGVCGICKSIEKLVVDHCHKTGKVRGLLCKNCNAGLGMFGDKIEFLHNASVYLETNSE